MNEHYYAAITALKQRKRPIGLWVRVRVTVIFMVLLTISMIFITTPGFALHPGPDNQGQRLQQLQQVWTFQGRVYKGNMGEEMHPLQGVRISLYGANNPYPQPGKLIRTTVTDHKGWYGLKLHERDGVFEFYRIRESDPGGYISVGATSVHGKVRDKNCIEYEYPLKARVLTGNKFWDRRREDEIDKKERPPERKEPEYKEPPERPEHPQPEIHIHEVHPPEARCGSEITLNIRGAGFHPRSQVLIPEGIEIRHIRFINPGELEVTIFISEEAPPGPRPMEITTPEGEPAIKEPAFIIHCERHEPEEPMEPIQPVEPVKPVEEKEMPDTLLIGDFTLPVDTYTNTGEWIPDQNRFIEVSGSAWLSFNCGTWVFTLVEPVDTEEMEISNTFKVVADVTNPKFEISVKEAQQIKPGVKVGDTIQLAKTFVEMPSQQIAAHQPPVDHKKYLEFKEKEKKGDVLVYFEHVTIEPVPGKPHMGRITLGEAVYPTQPLIPDIIKLYISGFTVFIDHLKLTPDGAIATMKLQLPGSIVSIKDCEPALLDLGKTVINPKCEFYRELSAAAFGTWLMGDSAVAMKGTGFIADFSSSKSPLSKPASWKGLVLKTGKITGHPLVPTHANTGYLAGNYTFSNGVVTQPGFDGQLSLSGTHTFYPVLPEGYTVELRGGSLKVSKNTIVSGQLGPGTVKLPTAAVCDKTPGDPVRISFSQLSVQQDLDLSGVMKVDAGTAVTWGELTHSGDEIKAWQAVIQDAYFYLPAEPKPSFSPDTGNGFLEVTPPGSGTTSDVLKQLESLDMAGITIRKIKNFYIYSPDNPLGTTASISFINPQVWLRIGEQGVDGQIRSFEYNKKVQPGNKNRNGYVGNKPFQMTWSDPQDETPIRFQYASSAVYDSEINGFLKIPMPCNFARLNYKDMETTSTANFVGGRLFLPDKGLKLAYWKLGFVPTAKSKSSGAPGTKGKEAGVVSVRTGRLIFTAAGIKEPVHFTKAFPLTWAEILADGNIKKLVLDHNTYGQKFDGLSFSPHNLVLSKYKPKATDGYMDVCGTVHVNFFGSHFINIRDARYDKDSNAPYKSRYVKVPKKGEASKKPTNLHLKGKWNKDRAVFDFPDATMKYNEKFQEGFIGTGTGSLALLKNAKLDASIKIYRTATDICLESKKTHDVDLQLLSHLGSIKQAYGCVRIVGPTLKRIAVNGYLESSAGVGAGILSAKGASKVETILSVSPTSTVFFVSGDMYLAVADQLVEISGYARLTKDFLKKSADGEVKAKINCESILAGLSGSGQMTWHADPKSQYFQGKIKVAVCSWIGAGGLEGGFFVGTNAPKTRIWVLSTGTKNFGISPNILPTYLTGLYGYGQVSFSVQWYIFGGGIDLYAGMGVFSNLLTGSSPKKEMMVSAQLPYIVGGAGVHVHGEILGGLVSASAWGNLSLLMGTVPYFEGSFGLKGCVLWVICESIEVTAGISPSKGFYMED